MKNLAHAFSSSIIAITLITASIVAASPASAAAPTNCMLIDPPVSLTSNLSSKEEALRNDHIVDCQKGKVDGPTAFNGALSKDISTPGDVPDGQVVSDRMASLRR